MNSNCAGMETDLLAAKDTNFEKSVSELSSYLRDLRGEIIIFRLLRFRTFAGDIPNSAQRHFYY